MKNRKIEKTLVEFTCKNGAHRIYIDPNAVDCVTIKRNQEAESRSYMTIIMLHNGNYVVVDGTPAEAYERLTA